MLHARIVTHRLHVVDDVVGVFLERVIHARLEVGLRAVVVHAEAAADVDELEPGARLHQLRVDARRFVERPLDDPDVGDLAPEMEVQEPEAVLHATRLELFEAAQYFSHREPELRAVAA